MARASIHIMNLDKKIYDEYTSSSMCSHINVGSGTDLTVKELAEKISMVVGFKGDINFDPSKPDGSARKLLDSKRIQNLGFKYKINLMDGLKKTYKEFLKFNENI